MGVCASVPSKCRSYYSDVFVIVCGVSDLNGKEEWVCASVPSKCRSYYSDVYVIVCGVFDSNGKDSNKRRIGSGARVPSKCRSYYSDVS